MRRTSRIPAHIQEVKRRIETCVAVMAEREFLRTRKRRMPRSGRLRLLGETFWRIERYHSGFAVSSPGVLRGIYHEDHPELKASIQRLLQEEGASLLKALRPRG